MDRVTEFAKWDAAEYPYDNAECGNCATEHDREYCFRPEHAEMRQEARELHLDTLRQTDAPEFRSTVLAFREKYARFYAPQR